jgi:hypothetical protein
MAMLIIYRIQVNSNSKIIWNELKKSMGKYGIPAGITVLSIRENP